MTVMQESLTMTVADIFDFDELNKGYSNTFYLAHMNLRIYRVRHNYGNQGLM